jgi:tRNA (cmo5U34)-methyltransferase
MRNDIPRDNIFGEPRPMIVDFVFDDQVVKVFPDMIRRSVPGYDTLITLLGLFAQEYTQADSNLYDLGCSTGAVSLALRRRIAKGGCRIIAVDNSSAMVAQCKQNLALDVSTTPVTLVCDDIQSVPIENASLVVLNFTLQFLPPAQRLALLTRIYQGLLPGGVFVLSEKVVFDPQEVQAFQEAMQLAFKKANGYSELEISQKRTALENVLIPDSIEQHRLRLQQAGFARIQIWFQAFNFISIAAVK